MDIETWLPLVAILLSAATLLHKVSSGFTKMEIGQHNLRGDFKELKIEMKETKNELTEMKLDVTWVQASTKTPPRPGST